MSSATSSSHDSATGCGDSQHTRSGDIPAHWPRRPLAAPRNPEKLRGVTLRMNAMYKLVAVTAVVAALTILSASTPGGRPSTEPPCSSAVRKGPLPIWARGGFHPSTQRIPHVLGRSGALVAILFSYPLNASPPARHPANKILWKPRLSWNTPTNLRISAQRIKGTRLVGKPVRRKLKGGPGPSFFDLPTGCWRLSLHWAGRSDGLDLQYRSSA